MSKFKDHPTWQMLEKTKLELKVLLNDISDSMQDIPLYTSLSTRREIEQCAYEIREQHNAIVKLQLDLENKLCMD